MWSNRTSGAVGSSLRCSSNGVWLTWALASIRPCSLPCAANVPSICCLPVAPIPEAEGLRLLQTAVSMPPIAPVGHQAQPQPQPQPPPHPPDSPQSEARGDAISTSPVTYAAPGSAPTQPQGGRLTPEESTAAAGLLDLIGDPPTEPAVATQAPNLQGAGEEGWRSPETLLEWTTWSGNPDGRVPVLDQR